MADPPRRRPTAPGIPDHTLPPPPRVVREETDPRALRQQEEREAEESRRAAARQRRRASQPDSDPPPTPPAPTSQKLGISLPKGSPWFAYVLLAAISTGAGGGLVEALRPKGPSSEQIENLRTEIRALRADQREILDFIRRQTRVEHDRDEAQSEWICRANAGSWIRGYDCGSIDIESTPLASTWIGPKFKLRAEWPLASRPP